MNVDAISVSLEYIKKQIEEIKVDVRQMAVNQKILEDEIRKGYVTKEEFVSLKADLNTVYADVKSLQEKHNELKLKVAGISTGISIAVAIIVWILEHFILR